MKCLLLCWLSLPERIQDKIAINHDFVFRGTRCWQWIAARQSNGYGVIGDSKRVQRAHRVVYTMTRGPIPDGLQIDHLCHRRWCVNPFHLEAVTSAVNNARSDTASAQNARKTHCKRGHEFTPGNTYLRKRGRNTERFCRACRTINMRAWHVKNYRSRARKEPK